MRAEVGKSLVGDREELKNCRVDNVTRVSLTQLAIKSVSLRSGLCPCQRPHFYHRSMSNKCAKNCKDSLKRNMEQADKSFSILCWRYLVMSMYSTKIYDKFCRMVNGESN